MEELEDGESRHKSSTLEVWTFTVYFCPNALKSNVDLGWFVEHDCCLNHYDDYVINAQNKFNIYGSKIYISY